jgi:hypothetical protein
MQEEKLVELMVNKDCLCMHWLLAPRKELVDEQAVEGVKNMWGHWAHPLVWLS